jgi:cell division protein FtsL
MNQRKLLAFNIMLITLLCAFQVFISHRLSTAGIEVSSLSMEIRTVSLENEDIRHKIASYSSLKVIAEKAQQAGFTEQTVRYLDHPPIALFR